MLKEVSIRCLANQFAQITNYNRLHLQYIERRKNRGHPWSEFKISNGNWFKIPAPKQTKLVGDLICSVACSLVGMRH